jgi:hypothetical protein
VSPAHGLPYEWSYPFTLDRPSPAYLDTGWLTFSPTYYKILAHFGIASLPLALLQRDDIYLMAEESLTVFIARYYREHFSLDVDFREIYAMPNPRHRPGYDDIRIYSLHAKGGLTD